MRDDAADRIRRAARVLPGRPAYRAGAGLLGAVALVLLFQLTWATPRRARLAVQQQELALAPDAQAEAASIDRRLAGLAREIERLGQEYDRLARAFPTSREAPILLRRLPAIAAQSGLTLRAYAPRPPETVPFDDPAPNWTIWGVQLEFTGRFHDVVGFLDRISALPQVIRVSALSFSASDPASPAGTILVSGVAETQAIEPPADRVPSSPAQGAAPSDTPAPPVTPTYDPGGRRDPFVPLAGTAPAPNGRPPGLAGIAAGELSLRGIVVAGGVRAAVLEAAGGRSWLVRGGERLLDGVIGLIGAETVEVQPVHGATTAPPPFRLRAAPQTLGGDAADGDDPDIAAPPSPPGDAERHP